MRKVFRNADEVLHVFVQQTQHEGRNSSGNVFFEGSRVYSYGRHYLLGEFVTNLNGEEALIINDNGYSKTTSKHIRWLAYAASHKRVFYTSETDLESVNMSIVNNLKNLERARKPEIYTLTIDKLINDYKNFRAWLGVPESNTEELVKFNALENAYREGGYFEYIKFLKDFEKNKKAKAIAAAKKRLTSNLRKFKAYKLNSFHSENSYLRLSKRGEYVETSGNLRIKAKEAKILYMKITLQNPVVGMVVAGHYEVTSVTGKYLTVGCHKIPMVNVHAVGRKLLQQT